MAEVIYLLCAITSTACALLLFRGYRHSGAKLLFWSGLSFTGLALNSILLFVDLVVVPNIDLAMVRAGIALAAMMVLLFGLVWESR